MSNTNLSYPIGKWHLPKGIDEELFKAYAKTIKEFPETLRLKLASMTTTDLKSRYRPGGWTKAQVVNHLADSHVNAYCRVKIVLTEYEPTIRPYNQSKWAEVIDAIDTDLSSSVKILEGVHSRWSDCLTQVKTEDLSLKWNHPEQNQSFTFLQLLAMYDWHCRHHLAHLNLPNVV